MKNGTHIKIMSNSSILLASDSTYCFMKNIQQKQNQGYIKIAWSTEISETIYSRPVLKITKQTNWAPSTPLSIIIPSLKRIRHNVGKNDSSSLLEELNVGELKEFFCKILSLVPMGIQGLRRDFSCWH